MDTRGENVLSMHVNCINHSSELQRNRASMFTFFHFRVIKADFSTIRNLIDYYVHFQFYRRLNDSLNRVT